MNHKHRKVLHALFAHPVSANISPKRVSAMLVELGAEVEQRHGGRVGIHLNGRFAELPHPKHSLPKEDVRRLAKFLNEADIDPGRDYPL